MKLTNEQNNAINHIKGPALVLAVPGSGKTTVLNHRAYNLINNHNINHNRILSITFSKASAIDMKKRYKSNFPNDSRVPKFSTIHAFSYGIIRDYVRSTGNRLYLIENSRNKVNKYNILKNLYFKHNNEFISDDKLESIINYIGYIKNMMISIDDFIDTYNPDISNFKYIFEEYEDYKNSKNLLDFDDMLTKSLNLLEASDKTLKYYQNKFDFIQVDEGQDTSKLQMEIIKILVNPKNNLFIVADDDQSIYGFRGAFPEGLLNFDKYFDNSKKFFMEENFRSSRNIVDLSNKFIKNNKNRYDKNIYTNNDYFKSVLVVETKNPSEQYSYINNFILDNNLNPEDCCILYRNNLSSLGVVESFNKQNIPFITNDMNMRFFNHWIIDDIINILKFSEDTSNILLYSEFYYKLKGFISKKQIEFVINSAPDSSVFKKIMEYPDIPYYYKNTLTELESDFNRMAYMNPEESINLIENTLEYDNYLRENASKFGNTYETSTKILYYLKLISKNTSSNDEFINKIDEMKQLYFRSKKENRGVNLSTVHSAKGLEYDTVFMIDLVEGEFPSNLVIDNSVDCSRDMEEERRLFYVGMTRAKNNLILLTTKTINGNIVLKSPFLDEILQIK